MLPNCKIMHRIKIFFFLLCSVLPSKAQSYTYKEPTQKATSIVFNGQAPKHEVRAVWLTTIGGIDWPHSYAQSSLSAEKQKQELRSILDRLQKAHINTVLLQTRIRGTMIYPTSHGMVAFPDFPAEVQATMHYSLPSTNVTNVAWNFTLG